MKTLEKVLAIALFTVGALSLVAGFGILALDDYRLLVLVVAAILVPIGVLSVFYGYVRRANLQHRTPDLNDRNSPPNQFIALGWGMLAVSIILFGAKVLWLS